MSSSEGLQGLSDGQPSTQRYFSRPIILFVDEDQGFLSMAKSVAKKNSCVPIVATDGSTALLKAAREKFAGVIISVDINRIQESVDLAHALRKVPGNYNTPVCLLVPPGRAISDVSTYAPNFMTQQKPQDEKALASAISTVQSDQYEKFSSIIVTENPQSVSSLVMSFNKNNISSSIIPGLDHALSSMLEHDPDLVFFDANLPDLLAWSEEVRTSPRWDWNCFVLINCGEDQFDKDALKDAGVNEHFGVAVHDDLVVGQAKELARRMRSQKNKGKSDSLTGLPLRDAFYKKVIPELERSIKGAGPVSISIVNVNELGALNERSGVDAGDRVLVALGSFLSQRFSDAGTLVTRYEGDRFAIFARMPGKALAVQMKNILLDFRLLDIPDVDQHMSISAALVSGPKDGKTVEELMFKADRRLHVAKRLDPPLSDHDR